MAKVMLKLYGEVNGDFVRAVPFEGDNYRAAVKAAVDFTRGLSTREWLVTECPGERLCSYWTHSAARRAYTEQEYIEALNKIHARYDLPKE